VYDLVSPYLKTCLGFSQMPEQSVVKMVQDNSLPELKMTAFPNSSYCLWKQDNVFIVFRLHTLLARPSHLSQACKKSRRSHCI